MIWILYHLNYFLEIIFLKTKFKSIPGTSWVHPVQCTRGH